MDENDLIITIIIENENEEKLFEMKIKSEISIDDIRRKCKESIHNKKLNIDDINLIYKDLPYKKRITVNSFKEIINEFNPDVFYLISFYFDKYCPFNIEQINYFKYNSNNNINNNRTYFSKTSTKIVSNKISFLNISPSKKLINFFKKNNINLNFDEDECNEEMNSENSILNDLNIF